MLHRVLAVGSIVDAPPFDVEVFDASCEAALNAADTLLSNTPTWRCKSSGRVATFCAPSSGKVTVAVTAPLLGVTPGSNQTTQWAPFELIAVTTGLPCNADFIDPLVSVDFNQATFRPR